MILLFFCTCNPPHQGHAYAVSLALKQIPGIEKVLIIPPRKHIWGKETLPYEVRMQMARDLFLPIDSRVEINRLEEANDLSGYTIDSLVVLNDTYPGQTFGMLVGEDTLSVFDKWKDWEKILALVPLYVIPTRKTSQLGAKIPDVIKSLVGKQVFYLDTAIVKPLTLSSSALRSRLVI